MDESPQPTKRNQPKPKITTNDTVVLCWQLKFCFMLFQVENARESRADWSLVKPWKHEFTAQPMQSQSLSQTLAWVCSVVHCLSPLWPVSHLLPQLNIIQHKLKSTQYKPTTQVKSSIDALSVFYSTRL